VAAGGARAAGGIAGDRVSQQHRLTRTGTVWVEVAPRGGERGPRGCVQRVRHDRRVLATRMLELFRPALGRGRNPSSTTYLWGDPA
jgi:hypothetical protein